MTDLDILDSLYLEQGLVLRFFTVFSRFEYSLKRGGFAKAGPYHAAQADWRAFGDSAQTALASLRNPEYIQALEFILTQPPRRQVYDSGAIRFVDSTRDQIETDVVFALRMVRTVRNNLFHGGKYPEGPVGDQGRDRSLLEACIVILKACLETNAQLQAIYSETA